MKWSFLIFAILFTLLLSIIYPRFLSILSRQGTINIDSLTGEFNSALQSATFNNKPVNTVLAVENPEKPPEVLGENSANKRIEVDLTNQRLYAFEGDTKVYDFAVSTGKWGWTPTGTFRIWTKLRYTLMTGGSQALGTYYYLPNVPYTMFFYNDEIPKYRGYGIHGTYWHNNFGHPMSHGCVNMKTEEAGQLFYWARPDLQGKNSIYATADNPGTEVIIYGTAPNE